LNDPPPSQRKQTARLKRATRRPEQVPATSAPDA
jgi:hypothetical protein